jgi:hypothetical protein
MVEKILQEKKAFLSPMENFSDSKDIITLKPTHCFSVHLFILCRLSSHLKAQAQILIFRHPNSQILCGIEV